MPKVDASQVLNAFAKLQNEQLPTAVEQALEKACLKVEADARRNVQATVHGETGQLAASISHEVVKTATGYQGFVGSNLDYAVFRHQGTGLFAIEGHGRKDVPWRYQDAKGEWHVTSGMEPNPFIQQAVDSNRAEIQDYFRRVLDDIK